MKHIQRKCLGFKEVNDNVDFFYILNKMALCYRSMDPLCSQHVMDVATDGRTERGKTHLHLHTSYEKMSTAIVCTGQRVNFFLPHEG